MASNSSRSPSRPDSSSSASLLHGLRARDTDAWQRLADLYGPLVFHWGRECRLSTEDATDIMQEVFAAVSTGIDRFLHLPNRGTFRGWLWTITRNKIRDLHRKRARRPHAIGGSDARHHLETLADSLSDDAAEPTHPSEATNLFHRGLELVRAEFADRTWQAFWRSVVEEESTADIAADLQISPNAVRQAKSRVLRRLRQELGDAD